MERGNVLLVASFGEGPWSVALPEGRYRVLLDSRAGQLAQGRLKGEGRQAVVLERD